jgi:hypothetical protein
MSIAPVSPRTAAKNAFVFGRIRFFVGGKFVGGIHSLSTAQAAAAAFYMPLATAIA